MPPLIPAEMGCTVLRQPQPVAGHARPQLLDAARRARHGLGPACRLGQGLVDVPPARQQLRDPEAQARDDDHGADHEEAQAEGHPRRQQDQAQGQHQRRDRRPGHLDGVRRGRVFGLRRLLAARWPFA